MPDPTLLLGGRADFGNIFTTKVIPIGPFYLLTCYTLPVPSKELNSQAEEYGIMGNTKRLPPGHDAAPKRGYTPTCLARVAV